MSAPLVDYVVPRLWMRWGGVFVAAAVVSGLVYAGAEALFTCSLRDALFILAVTLNAGIIYIAGVLLTPRLGQMLQHFPDPPVGTTQAWVDRILVGPGTWVMAVLWAVAMGCGFYFLDPWGGGVTAAGQGGAPFITGLSTQTSAEGGVACQGNPSTDLLNALAALFVFCGNLIIGMAIAAIARFWAVVLGRMAQLDLRILNLSHEPLPALQRANGLIVMASALVASLSIMGLLLSGYAIEQTLAAHTATTLLVVVGTYAVPMLPLTNRLSMLKSEALDHVEARIEAHVHHRSGQAPRPGGPLEDPDNPGRFHPIETLEPLDVLLETRDLIRSVRVLPPGGQISVSAAAIVTALSFMPAIIDMILNG